MLTKLYAEGRTTEADARSTWELLNQMPSKPGEFSPARIAFRRERRHPLIPALPAEGGEIEQGRKQQEDKEREQVRRNSKKGKNVKKPPPFKLGQRVLTQHRVRSQAPTGARPLWAFLYFNFSKDTKDKRSQLKISATFAISINYYFAQRGCANNQSGNCWLNLSRFTLFFGGDQTDPKFVCGGPIQFLGLGKCVLLFCFDYSFSRYLGKLEMCGSEIGT